MGEQVMFDGLPLSFRSQDSYLDTTPQRSYTASFALVVLRQHGTNRNGATAELTRSNAN
jgi:hypothetical protein